MKADVETDVVVALPSTVPRPIACAGYWMFAIAAISAPTDPAVWKSVPESRSVNMDVTMPVEDASAGGVIAQPELAPN